MRQALPRTACNAPRCPVSTALFVACSLQVMAGEDASEEMKDPEVREMLTKFKEMTG